MEYAVSREGTTLVTLHGGSDTTACDEATAEIEEALDDHEAETAITDWTVTGAEVHEHPTAPFDPYTIAVWFDVVVAVEAADGDEASDRGADLIESALATAGFESVSYTSAPTVEA